MSSTDDLYEAFSRYPSGVALVATTDGRTDSFFVAASILTASVDPFALTVSMASDRGALAPISSGAPWTVSLLGEHHVRLTEALTEPAPDVARTKALERFGAERSAEGPLWLPDAIAAYWLDTHSLHEVGDQMLVTGVVSRAVASREGRPLVRWSRGYHSTVPLP